LDTPLGLDVPAPRFSWQMRAPEDGRGWSQSAYQIVVADPSGSAVWDSGKVASRVSLGVAYEGAPLRASTRYSWSVTAWDQRGDAASESSWFETGLMSPDLSAWDGATWIGGGDDDLVLYSHYLPIFRLAYTVTIDAGSSRAGFVLGANDMRLMDRYKNVHQLENARDESYLEVELDVSAVDGSEDGRARLNVYRVGFAPADSRGEPFHSFPVAVSVIGAHNKHAPHRVVIEGVFGQLGFTLDGNASFTGEADEEGGRRFGRGPAGETVNVNPMGQGGDYVTYGLLCDIGFAAGAGQRASFSDVEVANHRAPHSVLFREDLDGSYAGIFVGEAAGLRVEAGAYRVDGGSAGVFAVADPSRNSTPMLRTEFDTGGRRVRDARLHVTARGIYELYLNGERVGDDYYNPGLTQYDHTHMYQTYDVTEQVRSGPNALGAMLGEGWWSGLLSFGTIWNHFGDRQSLLAKLVVRYEDDSRQVVTSKPGDWRYYGEGPVRYSSLTQGEVYDATREAAVEGWSAPGYDDGAWKPAREVRLEGTAFVEPAKDFRGRDVSLHFDRVSLVGQIGSNAGVFRTLTARSVREVRDGVYVYDMGQNLVGVPRIRFEAGEAGRRVVVRVAEMLYPDLEESGLNVGMVMRENYRAATSQDVYVMKDGPQVFQPRFTSHGYQYLEITGIDAPLPLEAVEGVAISSVLELTADYESSNPRVNQLWSNLVWSNVDNFLSVPTDCPQRNERMGWSGDISVFSRTATYVSQADPFLTRHLLAMRDVQSETGRFTDIAPVGGGFGGVLWGSAGITVPWEVYRQYGDVRLLEEHYDAMASYLAYLETTIDEDGLISDSALGDWLGPQNEQLGNDFLVTAYHVYDLWIMARTAELLGKTGDAERYRRRHDERKAFFNETFLNEQGKTLGLVGGPGPFGGSSATPAEWKVADTQTSYAVALALGAFSDENVPQAQARLAESVERANTDDGGVTRPPHSLMTGFIGTAWISRALSDAGRDDLAYRLLQNAQYPSWLYAVDQGATTIWERLNGYTVENGFGGNNSMNSFNHYSFGAIGQWLMAYSLGIERGEPGFKRFVLQPRPDPTGQMTWARGHYDSMYGRIESAWKVEGSRLSYSATVPANTTATLRLPALSLELVTEGDQPAAGANGIEVLGHEGGTAVFELQPGRYRFQSEITTSG
jgi:alpha-L-rhamnosidase